ncbi:unnamed protein product [Sphenostylis stenocarpa]|uniref:Peptidase C51 domain-containing protein n=1 Tax=Sphenostylis stenocarpa TaxID=92480 RepID=A0AA86SRJ8_9FABA|nr:unnamed protein product [Sphenostylis stenocarpa]
METKDVGDVINYSFAAQHESEAQTIGFGHVAMATDSDSEKHLHQMHNNNEGDHRES